MSTTESFAGRNEVLTRLKIATALCSCFLVVEAIGGYFAGSLAILSDAAHLFADLAGFAVAIAASYLAHMPPTEWYSFGLKRTESLAALLSMLSLVFVSLGLAYEAVVRLMEGSYTQIDGPLMTVIAGIGVIVNIVLAFVLGEHHIHLPGMDHSHDHDHSCGGGHDHGHNHHEEDEHQHDRSVATTISSHTHEHDHHATTTTEACTADHHSSEGHSHTHAHGAEEEATSLLKGSEFPDHGAVDHHTKKNGTHGHKEKTRNVNLHAAYIHVLGDLAQSAAVLIAGCLVWLRPDWAVLDPIITLLFCLLVLLSTVGVLKNAIAVLLEQVPPNVSLSKIHGAICNVPGVTNVHALHIWSISHGEPALSVHCAASDPGEAMRAINSICLADGIRHSTLQVQPSSELEDDDCYTCKEGDSCLCFPEKTAQTSHS